jgi:hypothetical protein
MLLVISARVGQQPTNKQRFWNSLLVANQHLVFLTFLEGKHMLNGNSAN